MLLTWKKMIEQKLFVLLFAGFMTVQLFAGIVDGAPQSLPPHLSHINEDLYKTPLIPNRCENAMQFSDILADTRHKIQGKENVQVFTEVPEITDALCRMVAEWQRNKQATVSNVKSKSYSEAVKPLNQRDSKLVLPELEDAFYGGMSTKQLEKQPISSQLIDHAVSDQYTRHATGFYNPVSQQETTSQQNSLSQKQIDMVLTSLEDKFDKLSPAMLDSYARSPHQHIREMIADYRQRKRR